jgi:hypothetical protein
MGVCKKKLIGYVKSSPVWRRFRMTNETSSSVSS